MSTMVIISLKLFQVPGERVSTTAANTGVVASKDRASRYASVRSVPRSSIRSAVRMESPMATNASSNYRPVSIRVTSPSSTTDSAVS
jgi:hypothetical protein